MMKMTYKQSLQWLFDQLPFFQNKGKSAYKKDLTNIKILCEHLDHPQKKIKTIHVGGTNGKGSTSHIIASVLQSAGYKVGLYTSPHLIDFRERIRINGNVVPENYIQEFVGKHREFIEAHSFSFFEVSVAMAFDYFSKQEVAIAVIEVGLGGKLDSTNIIEPEISVITNIGLDHIHILGDTHTEIAEQKAGIIKPNTPCIIGQTRPDTKEVFITTAQKNNAPIFFAEDLPELKVACDLKGNYQQYNIKTAYQSIFQLRLLGWEITSKHLENGMKNVVKNTGLLGRWQILSKNPLTLCDTAHNAEGLQIVMNQLQELANDKQLHIVFGVVKDKNLEEILPLLPKKADYYFTKPTNFRAFPEEELLEKAKTYNLKGNSYPTVGDAFKEAQKNANKNEVIFVGGSTFVVAEALAL